MVYAIWAFTLALLLQVYTRLRPHVQAYFATGLFDVGLHKVDDDVNLKTL